MKSKIIFRADGNSLTGLGHLFRLFALVEIFKDDYEYVLITKESSLIEVIPKEYNLKILPEDIDDKNEPKWLNDYYSSTEYLIIADGYQFNSNYQKEIKFFGFTLVYIDDFSTEHMYADIVINHSTYVKPSDFSAETYTRFALGTEYAILRPSFLSAGKKEREITNIKNVFVCFGGADFNNITQKCVEGVSKINEINEVHVVLGGAYKHQNIFPENNKKVFIYRNLSEKNMLQVMKKCQLGIVPSSTISYESCSIKMLILGGYYVDNQINMYKGLEENEMIYSGGNFNLLSESDFRIRILEILKKPSFKHQKMINNQKKHFDGKGKERFILLLNTLI